MNKIHSRKATNKLLRNSLLIFLAVHTTLILPVLGSRMPFLKDSGLVEKADAAGIQTAYVGVERDAFGSNSTNVTNRHALSVGGTWWDGSFGYTASYIKFNSFNLPPNAIIVSANLNIYLRNWYYNSDGRDITLDFSRVDQWWPVDSTRFYNGTYFGSATLQKGGLEVNNRIDNRVVPFPVALANEMRSGGTYGVKIDASGSSAGAFICSSDNFGMDGAFGCEAQYVPRLEVQYILNQPPYTPAPALPANNFDFSGNCDESVVPATGACRTGNNLTLTLNGVGDGDQSPGNHREVHFAGTNTSTAQNFDYRKDVTLNDGNPTQQSYSGNFADGKYVWYGYSIDYYNLRGQNSVPFNFTTDTTPPTVPVLNALPEFTPGVGLDQTVQFEITPTGFSTDNIATNEEVGYMLEYSTDPTFATNTFAKPVQRFTATSPRIEIGPKGADGIEGNADDLTQETAYYFRMKVKDKLGNISAWSNTVTSKIDSTKPVASDITINPLRFSPQNATSVGSFDLLEFGYKFSEANTKSVGFEVLDKDFNVVYRFTEAPATVSNTDTTLNYTWNGLDSKGVAVIDGAYIIRPYLDDLAGNVLTIKETEHQRLFTLDNTGVDVIFNQVQDLWINTTSTKLTGQVIDVGDLQTFEFSLNGLGDLVNVSSVQGFSYDENSDQWSYAANLVEGLNKFFFRTTDTVENKQDFERNINLDTSKPSLMNFGITNPKDSQYIDLSNTDSNLFNSNNGIITFEIQDAGSGLKIGTNPDSYKLTTIIKSWDRETQSFYDTTKELIKLGVNLDANFNTDLVCNPSVGFSAKTVNGIQTADKITCSIQLKSLGDTDYYFKLDYSDSVGNSAENTFQSDVLEVDGFVYLEVRSPKNGANYPTKKVDTIGFASRGSTMNIKNIQTGLDESFLIDTNLDPQIIGDFEITKIVCGTFINHDNNPLTEDEEVCRYDLKTMLYYDPLLEITPNTLEISVTDPAANISTQSISANVSINNFAVAISPSSVYLSPNGDGYQEDVTFFHFVYNPEDPFNKPQVKSYSLKIKNANGDIVKEFIGLAGLDSYNYWNLKDEAGNTVPDGEYKYQISVISIDDIEKLSQEKSIFINTTVEDRTYISTPINGTETTNGVVTIQGQAPATNAPESQTPLRGQIFANICVDALVPAGVNVPDYIVAADRYPLPDGSSSQSPLINFGQGDNVGCDHWQEVLVDENGFFSTVIIFPSIEGLPSVSHNITAYSTDLFGNSTPNSNQVSITIDGADPFIEVYLEPTLTGVSTLEDYNKFLNGEISIEDIRSLRIRSVVRGGTEQVELSFADYSNVTQRPDSPTYNFIALLTNRIEQDLKKNPRQVENIKYNHNKVLGDATVPYENCNPDTSTGASDSCVWDYLLPMTDEYGGIYEIKFKGKRGTTIEEMTRGFQVDGRIPAAPVFMVIEKWDEATQTWVKMENVDFDNFTDVSKIRFRGAAEPFTQVELWTADVLDENGNVIQSGVKFADVIVGNTGVWEFIIDLEDFIDAGGSIDNLPGGPGDTSDETCSGIECFRSRLGFILKGFKVDREGNPVQLDENGNPDTVISEDSVVVNYDRKAPVLQTVDRITPDRTIQGWAQTGDQSIFNLKFDEAVFVGELIKEDGFVRLLDKISEVKDDKGIVIEDNYTSVVNVDDPFEGIYNITVRAKDLAENRKSYLAQNYQQYNVNDFRIFVDNTKPDNTSIDNSSTEWSTTWEQGGLNSGKRDETVIAPVYEKGRTNPEYVTKSDYVEIRGRAEKNQRIEIFMAVPNLDANGNLIPDDRPAIERGGQVVDIINVSDENCVAYSFDKVTFDGVTTKYNSLCDWSYKYYFTDNGANVWDGTPLSGYVLQARVIDKAANESDWTNTIIIYHDKTAPSKPYITKVASSAYSPIVGWNIINPEGDVITNPYPVTKDTAVTITTDAERFGDLVIKAENPKGENILDRTSINDSDREVFTDISLGDQTDERVGCTTMQGLRRVGTCQDGLYKFSVNVTDAVGYTSETRVAQVERDTVKPETPTVSLYKVGSNIRAIINGEPESQIVVNNVIKEAQTNTNSVDLWIGWGQCERTYTFSIQLLDRARNISDSQTASITMGTCPRVLGDSSLKNLEDSEDWGTKDDPYAGSDYRSLGELYIEYDYVYNWNATQMEKYVKSSNIPAPRITYVEVDDSETVVGVYGIAIPKNAKIKIKMNYVVETTYTCWVIFTCKGYDWKYKEEFVSADHAGLGLIKDNREFNFTWDIDQSTGRWHVQTGIQSNGLVINDEIYAKTKLYNGFNIDLEHHGNTSFGYSPNDWWAGVESGESNRVKIRHSKAWYKNEIYKIAKISVNDSTEKWFYDELVWMLEVFSDEAIPAHLYNHGYISSIERNTAGGPTSAADFSFRVFQDQFGNITEPVNTPGKINIYNSYTSIQGDTRYGKINLELGFKITLVHEFSHAYQLYDFFNNGNQNLSAHSEISWDDSLGGIYYNWPMRTNAVETNSTDDIGDFVTWYAMDNPSEDWAESVTVFLHSNKGDIEDLYGLGTDLLRSKRNIIDNIF